DHRRRFVTSSTAARTTSLPLDKVAAADSSALARISVTTTFMPAATQACAMPNPIPLAAPVMKATLSSRCCIGVSAWLGIESDGHAPQTRLRLAIAAHHQGIMAWNDVVRPRRQLSQTLPARDHLHEVCDDRERPAGGHVGEIVRRIGRKNDPTETGPDANHLQAMGMPTHVMHRNAGHDSGI